MKAFGQSASRRKRSDEQHEAAPAQQPEIRTQSPPRTSSTSSRSNIDNPQPDEPAAQMTSPFPSSSSSAAFSAGDVLSMRSRASSVISTGTKFSFTTLAQGAPPPPAEPETHSGPIDVLLGRRNFRITARPGSILSISSFDTPAPPYTEHASEPGQLLGPAFEGPTPSSSAPDMIHSPTPRRPTTSDTDLTLTPTPQQRLGRQPPVLAIPPSQHAALADAPTSTDTTDDPNPSDTSTPSPPSPPLSPLSSSQNALSAHYTTIVRTIDANHSAELARLATEHAAAIAQMRNDIDAAYRATLTQAQARALAVADETRAAMRPLLDALEAQNAELAARVEELGRRLEEAEARREEEVMRARNEVEDVWEGRWRDRMRLAEEQVRGAWVDGGMEARAWERIVRERWPEGVETARAEVERERGLRE